MMYAIILFCSVTVAAADCDEVSARAYERVPGGHELPFNCFKQAEVWAAEHHLTPRDKEFTKVRCSRSEFGGRVG